MTKNIKALTSRTTYIRPSISWIKFALYFSPAEAQGPLRQFATLIVNYWLQVILNVKQTISVILINFSAGFVRHLFESAKHWRPHLIVAYFLVYHSLTCLSSAFDHSVALCELHLHALDAGASLLVVPGCVFTQDPMLFWRVLSEHKIAYTFAPNSFLAAATRAYEDSKKRASNHSDLAFSFRRLKVLFCGGEANKTSTLAAAAELLSSFGAPANAVTAVYGLSETCSALFYNRAGPSYDVGQKNAFASVGVPLPGHHLRIVDNFNQSIQSTNTQGSVQLRGSTIFQAYFNNVNATDAAITEDGWFDTGDLGSLDKLGNLRIAGRTKDVFIINGQNFSCGDLEYAIENCNLDGIEPGYTVSFSIWPDDGDTEEVVILYNPIHDQFDISSHLERTIKGIAGEVVQFCKKRPYMVIPLPRSYLPRSSIGKLSRAKLRSLFLAGEFRQFEHHQKATNSDSSCLEPRQAAIASVFSQYLGIPYASLSPDTLIESLGIDSLSYLKLLSGLERTFSLVRALSMNDLMACSTIRKMDAMIVHATEETRTTTYRPVEVLRATGSKTPLILCHTGNGGFLNYLALWPMIPDRKILALHAPSAETQHGAFPSLTQMLDTYVEAIKSHQPLGPYAFLGFCFGGVLAFELTKRFEALGDEVVFCGGLDSPPDVSIMKDTRFSDDIIDERHHLMSILISVDMVDRNDVPMLLEKLSAVPNKDVLKQTVSMLTQAALDRAGLSESKLQSWVTMSADIYRIAVDYLPSGSVRSFDAFYATSPPIGTDIPDAARWRSIYIAEWKSYVLNATNRDICFDYAERSPRERAGRPLRLHCIEGTHETMTTPENVCALGRRINDMILLREREWDIPSEK